MSSELFGLVVKDKVTGFQGVAYGYCQYVTGCDQVLVIPECTDNKYEQGTWFDVPRIEVVKEGKSRRLSFTAEDFISVMGSVK